MLIVVAYLASLATLAIASPILVARQSIETNPFVFTNSNGLNFTQMNTSLPNVAIFATGGTIAGSGSSSVETAGYSAGTLGIMALISAVPELLNVSNVAGIQISNVASSDITSSIRLTLSKQITKYVCEDDSMAGAVVTHGTDTLEETAFFLDATVNCRKPIVIVGAMRPATAISADGPFNLLQAVTVAADPKSRDRGALVVFNDRITSAFYVTKTNANSLDTFKAPEMGHLGALVSNTPYFYYPPIQPTGKKSYSVSNVTAIPRVDILFAYQDMANDTLYSAVANGAKGIVIAGAGAGSVSSTVDATIDDVVSLYGIPVVESTRAMSGEVPSANVEGERIASGYLNPMKSRILLGLLLAHGKNLAEIQGAFAPSTGA